MITQTEAELKIRNFLSEELMKEWAGSISLNEDFELDSIDQVDLRVFLEDVFLKKITVSQKPFRNIQSIVEFLGS